MVASGAASKHLKLSVTQSSLLIRFHNTTANTSSNTTANTSANYEFLKGANDLSIECRLYSNYYFKRTICKKLTTPLEKEKSGL